MNLRCASCGHALKLEEARPVRIWGVFRCRGARKDLGPQDRPFVSRRCRACGFVNVFEVLEKVDTAAGRRLG